MKKILKKMKEAVGNIVAINGMFVVIDHADKAKDGKGVATIVTISVSNNEDEDREIHGLIESFHSGRGRKLNIGETNFVLADIRRNNPLNDLALKHHKESTRMIVVKNEKTEEFFLLIDRDVSLTESRRFINAINEEKDDLLWITESFWEHHRRLSLPYQSMLAQFIRPKFKAITNGDITAVKLRVK